MLTPQDALEKVQKIDFAPIFWKLKNPLKGEGMSDEELRSGCLQYQQWLALQMAFPEEHTPPSEIIDVFWHAHILDTSKYAEDCKEVFGFFLHHFPYTGWQGEEAKQAHDVKFELTKQLFEQYFGGNPGVNAICTRFCDDDIHQDRPSYIPV